MTAAASTVSSPWQTLLPSAMVGSERKPVLLPALAAQFGGEMGTLVAAAAQSAAQPPAQLLRAAAVIATCGLAGAQGREWSAPLPPAATADRQPTLSDPLIVARAGLALAGDHARLHAELFAVLARSGWRLPAALLPRALELGRRSVALRASLLPVLGERGLWLAALNDDWRYAAGVSEDAGDERLWHEGSNEQRRAFLRAERVRDAAAARQRLRDALPELAVKERSELVAELATGLSLDDEALLDSLRGDRARDVRQAALALLLRLPASAHGQRAAARVATLLREERQLLRKRWRIDPPEAAASDWAADGVEVTRPKNDALGERAWWLYQLVRQVPLDWWTAHTRLDAEALVRWARDGDWGDALLRGWRDVFAAAPLPDWGQALLADERTAADMTAAAAIVAALPAELREAHWRQTLRKAPANIHPTLLQLRESIAIGQMIGPALSQQIVDTLAPLISHPAPHDRYSLQATLPDLACCLQLDALDRLDVLLAGNEDSPGFAELRRTLSEICDIRRVLSTIKPASSS